MNSKSPIFTFFSVGSALALTLGCVSSRETRVNRIQLGQLKADVLEQIGGPNSTARVRGRDVWEYRYFGDTDQRFKRTVVVYENQKVIEVQKDVDLEKQLLEEAERRDARHAELNQRALLRERNGTYTPNRNSPDGTATESL